MARIHLRLSSTSVGRSAVFCLGLCSLAAPCGGEETRFDVHVLSAQQTAGALEVVYRVSPRQAADIPGLPAPEAVALSLNPGYASKIERAADLGSRSAVVLLLDRSGSLGRYRAQVAAAARRFASALPAGVELSLLTVSDGTEALLRYGAIGTDLDRALGLLDVAPRPQKGKNRLYESMEQAIDVAKASKRELRSVVVFSDGERTEDDTFTVEHVVKAARGDSLASVPVHSLAWDKGQANAKNQRAIEDLRKIALETGGMHSRVSGADLDSTLDGWFGLLAVHAAGGLQRARMTLCDVPQAAAQTTVSVAAPSAAPATQTVPLGEHSARRCTCEADADCGGPRFCEYGYCAPKCEGRADCPTGLVCDAASGRCVECSDAAACGAGRECAQGRCVLTRDECGVVVAEATRLGVTFAGLSCAVTAPDGAAIGDPILLGDPCRDPLRVTVPFEGVGHLVCSAAGGGVTVDAKLSLTPGRSAVRLYVAIAGREVAAGLPVAVVVPSYFDCKAAADCGACGRCQDGLCQPQRPPACGNGCESREGEPFCTPAAPEPDRLALAELVELVLPKLEALLAKVPAFARSKIPYGGDRAGAEKLLELSLRTALGDDWRSVYVSRSRARELLSHLCDDVPDSVKSAMRLTGLWSSVCSVDVPLAAADLPETTPVAALDAGAAPSVAAPIAPPEAEAAPPKAQGGACGKCDARGAGPFGSIPSGAVAILIVAALTLRRRREDRGRRLP